MQIRFADQEDIAVLEQIEKSAPSPWSRALILSELAHPRGIQLVACSEKSNAVIGWCCTRHLIPEAELLKITVSQHNRRAGVGTLLLQKMSCQCYAAGCRRLLLEVREKNSTARSFYKKHGFAELSIRKNYYTDPVDNGIILQKTLRF